MIASAARAAVALYLLATLVSFSASADELAPRLHLETGAHTLPLTHLAVDESGRYLATASQDRTLRLFELPSGTLIRTLYLPIDLAPAPNTPKQRIYQVYQLALSPDGKTVFFTLAENGTRAYTWERDSGQVKRLPDEQISVEVLLKNGTKDRQPTIVPQYLSGATGWAAYRAHLPEVSRRDGHIVYGTRDGRFQQHVDRNFDSIDRDRGGRVVILIDNRICLYDRTLRHLAERALPEGYTGYSVRFSADGSRIAIGYKDRARIDVWSGTDLHPLYQPDISAVSNGNSDGDLRNLAFSADGSVLYASGTATSAGKNILRSYAEAGRGRYQDVAITDSEVTALTRLPRGGVAFATVGAAFGMVTAQGGIVHLSRPRAAANGQLLSVDEKAENLSFRIGDGMANLSLFERRLSLGAATNNADQLRPPRTSHPQVLINEWQGLRRVRVNDSDYQLDWPVRSLAIAPDGKRFLLGLDRELFVGTQLTDEQGSYIHKDHIGVTSPAVSVNISGDGQLLIAAMADGTIRWYSSDHRACVDGYPLLLTFFPSSDGKRWVLFTPSGYYDASPGGEELFGWIVDRSDVASADYLPATRFRARYHRPEVIDRVLRLRSESRALAEANEIARRQAVVASLSSQLPPVVELLSPAAETAVTGAEAVVRVRVRSASGVAVSALRVLIDGRPALRKEVSWPRSGASGSAFVEEEELRVPLPSQLANLAVIADSAVGASEPALIKLRRAEIAAAENGTDFSLLPNLYIVAIGISEYQAPDLRLRFAAKDATDLASTLRAQEGKLYRKVELKLLTNQQASRAAILDGLEWLRRQVTDKDVAVLFLAGHGLDEPSSGQYYFMPYDANLGQVMSTMIPDVILRATLAGLVGKVVLMLDTCHSGKVLGASGLRGSAAWTRFVNELSSAENGVVVLTASTGRQPSQEDPAWNNGAFTKALVEGLRGQADARHSGRVTLNMLDLYISERVKALTKGTQSPTTAKPSTVPDFPLSIVR